MSGTTENAATTSVTVRWGAGGWFCAGLFAAMGLCLVWFAATQSLGIGPKAALGCYALAIFGMGGWLATMAFERIDADAGGIRWRTWRGVKQITWSGVSDYYLLPTRRSNGHVLVTGQGTIRVSIQAAAGDALKELVRTCAADAVAKDWTILGCREIEPRLLVFDYQPRAQSGKFLISAILSIFAVVMMFSGIQKTVATTLPLLGWGWSLGMIAVVVAFCGCLLTMAWVGSFPMLSVFQKRGERIEITHEGIALCQGLQRKHAAWDEIIRVSYRPIGGWITLDDETILETAEDRFEITPAIRDPLLLSAILKHRVAAEAFPQEQKAAAPKRALSGHREQAVAFHYRTPVNRALLWMAWIYSGLPIAGAAIRHSALGSPLGQADFASGGVFALILLWTTCRYRRAEIVIDRVGISEFSAWGERRIRWEDVQSYTRGDGLAVVTGRTGKIRFWTTISELNELMDEIRKRAVKSANRDWNRREE